MTVQCEGRPPAAILTLTSEGDDMARGKRVRIDGRDRTIPAVNVPRYDAMIAALIDQYPGDEHSHELTTAVDTATRYLLGDAAGETQRVRDELAAARKAQEAAIAAARALILLAADDGTTEVALAADLRIDRLTVRKYRGKKDRR